VVYLFRFIYTSLELQILEKGLSDNAKNSSPNITGYWQLGVTTFEPRQKGVIPPVKITPAPNRIVQPTIANGIGLKN